MSSSSPRRSGRSAEHECGRLWALMQRLLRSACGRSVRTHGGSDVGSGDGPELRQAINDVFERGGATTLGGGGVIAFAAGQARKRQLLGRAHAGDASTGTPISALHGIARGKAGLAGVAAVRRRPGAAASMAVPVRSALQQLRPSWRSSGSPERSSSDGSPSVPAAGGRRPAGCGGAR